MPQVEESVKIDRPLNEVFRFAIDSDKLAQWQTDIKTLYQSDERPRVGVMITQTRSTRLLGWRLDLNADIIGYQPNRLLEYKGVLGRFPVAGRLEFGSEGGSTVVTERLNIRMGILFGVFSPLMSGVMKGRTRRALQNLKHILESRSAHPENPTDFHTKL